MWNATHLRTFCFEDYHFIAFYLSLYFYASDTFRPILSLLTHFALHQFFHMYITMRNIFVIPDDDADRRKLGNLIFIFNFSSQSPLLNYIIFSNVYSCDTMEFSMKHIC